jgi:sec-independent protein translocase protein TatC
MPPFWQNLMKAFRREDREMPFWEHLEELRRVVLRVIGLLLFTTLASYFISGKIMEEIVTRTIKDAVFLRPMEAFNARLKVAFMIGLLASIPFILWQIWTFVVPGLLHKEKKIVGPLVFWSVLLFYAGVAFSYLVVIPSMLAFLMGLGTEHIKAQIAVSYLLDFIVGMAAASGILFQLPVVVALLAMLGILRPGFLIKWWRHAVIGTFVLTAVVTPGDVFIAQAVLAVPVLILYFASIFVAKAIWRNKDKKHDLPLVGGGGGPRAG